MKLIKIFTVVSIATLIIFSGCKLEEPNVKSSADVQLSDATQAGFTSYVSLGNSLTAGYQSGAITQRDQQYSYVKQIATQAGVGDAFVQPLMGYPGIGTYTSKGAGIMELMGFDATGNPVIAPVPYATVPAFNPLLPYFSPEIMNHPAPYNNLGIPGIVLADLDNATSAVNSLSHSAAIDPILRNANPAFGNTTPIQQALLLQPTIITCWIGNNDVLGYATSGGYSPSTPSMDGATFQALYGAMLTKITSTGANAVVANIPDVTSIPFFNTIGPKIAASLIPNQVPGIYYSKASTTNPGFITDAASATAASTDDLLAGTVYVNLTASPYAGLVGQPTGAVYRDIATENGLSVNMVLGMMTTGVDTTMPFGLHPQNPIPHTMVLDDDEIAIASAAVADFNTAIDNAAGAASVPVVDANAVMADLADGYVISGLEFSADFLTGGVFSLDGVHPNSMGYALIANEFITVINENYDMNIPLVDITEFIKPVEAAPLAKKSAVNPNVYLSIPEIFGGSIK